MCGSKSKQTQHQRHNTNRYILQAPLHCCECSRKKSFFQKASGFLLSLSHSKETKKKQQLQWLTVASFSSIFPCIVPSPFSQQKSSSTGRSAGVRSPGPWLKPKCQKELQNSWDVRTKTRNCWVLDCIVRCIWLHSTRLHMGNIASTLRSEHGQR